MMTNPYTYVLVRRDIPLEQQMVQACHAALEAGFEFESPAITSSLIVCTVPDRFALLEAEERLARYSIRTKLFFEPDWGMGHSALASEPLFAKKQRYILAKYPLFVANNSAAGH